MLNQSSNTKIMGILNLTPDSFYDGGQFLNPNDLGSKFKSLLSADIIDVGAESSRPGALEVDKEIEKDRLSVIFDYVIKYNSKLFSIDSYKPEVARYALDNGFNIINDIKGGGNSNSMLELASEYNVPIVIMHMLDTPSTMQNNPKYINVIDTLMEFFDIKIEIALKLGVSEENIILDPGIGFGKRIIDNDLIISNLNILKSKGYPILIGVSRKSFLQVNGDAPKDRLSASIAVASLGASKGADIIRTHDVDETVKAITILDRVKNQHLKMEEV